MQIKFKDFKEGANAKERLRNFFWTENFFQLKEEQMEHLFRVTAGPLMGCNWWKKGKNIEQGGYEFLKTSLCQQEQQKYGTKVI